MSGAIHRRSTVINPNIFDSEESNEEVKNLDPLYTFHVHSLSSQDQTKEIKIKKRLIGQDAKEAEEIIVKLSQDNLKWENLP